MRVLVTGGYGFIGSVVVRQLLYADPPERLVSVDKETYAAARGLRIPRELRSEFYHVPLDLADPLARGILDELLATHEIDTVIHLAAETHVDRSLDSAQPFIDANITGTLNLLDAIRDYLKSMAGHRLGRMRFVYVSTDEVYGSWEQGLDEPYGHTESAPLRPSNPYSISKVAAEQLCQAYGQHLSLAITRGSNTFGVMQHPEKFLPLMIYKARHGEPLPIYGNGSQMRQWLWVEDHAQAIIQLARVDRGSDFEIYNIGGPSSEENLQVAQAIKYRTGNTVEIRPQPDRPRHDFRYLIDSAKFRRDFPFWRPECQLIDQVGSVSDGLAILLSWYDRSGRDWYAEAGYGDKDVERQGLQL